MQIKPDQDDPVAGAGRTRKEATLLPLKRLAAEVTRKETTVGTSKKRGVRNRNLSRSKNERKTKKKKRNLPPSKGNGAVNCQGENRPEDGARKNRFATGKQKNMVV